MDGSHRPGASLDGSQVCEGFRLCSSVHENRAPSDPDHPLPDPTGVVNALIENGVECQPNQNGDDRRHVVAMPSTADWRREDIV